MNNTALRFTGYNRKDKLLALRAHNIPESVAKRLLAEDKPIHVPMNQRLRELLNQRENYARRRNARRRGLL